MSRVNNDANRAQAEKAQEKASQASRRTKNDAKAKQRFGKMLKGKTEKSSQQGGLLARAKAQAQGKSTLAQKGESARNAQLARAGTTGQQRLMAQVKSFDETLNKGRVSSEKENESQKTSRDDGVSHDKTSVKDSQTDVDQRAENNRDANTETLRQDAKAEKKANAAIGDKKGGGTGGNSTRGDEAAGGAAQAAGPQGADQVAAGGKMGKTVEIPQEILDKLVKEVFVGVSAEGLSEFRIELKEGVLGGATMTVNADGGKISLRFSGLESGAKNLVSASRGDLMRRLGSKGLSLDRLTFA